jgi:hypothetical protein
LVPSAARTNGKSHVTLSDNASVPLNVTVTFTRRQPDAFGGGVADAAAVGGVASRLIVTLALLVPPVLVAWHVRVVPAVSVVNVTASHPVWVVTSDSGSLTVQSPGRR